MDRHTDTIAANVVNILHNIQAAAMRAGRRPDHIRVVAATKMVPVDRIEAAVAAGIAILGENRLQEALGKMPQLSHRPVTWHFIGRLQRRKVKDVVGRFTLIHSLDSIGLAEEINRRAEQAGLRQAVLLEVNIGGEASKAGFAPDALADVCRKLGGMVHLLVKGLMTIPPPHYDEQMSRGYFRQIRDLARSLTPSGFQNITMEELSMGMSGDYPIAVEEGATFVRIGTAIFGARYE
jgi:pyridoxal phosphate enzyme (YggS family)